MEERRKKSIPEVEEGDDSDEEVEWRRQCQWQRYCRKEEETKGERRERMEKGKTRKQELSKAVKNKKGYGTAATALPSGF